jgi:hypothetical protein
VFWMSSRTMRAALARRQVLQTKMTEAEAENYLGQLQEDYQIAVQGDDMRIFQKYDERYTQENSTLRMKKSKEKVTPMRVEFQRSEDGHTVAAVVFHFTKRLPNGSPLILPDEKSIEFICKLSGYVLDTAFDPQKMTDQAGPDL